MRKCFVSLVIGLTATVALAQYAIDWHMIDGGGGVSTNAVYSVSGIIGQPDTSKTGGGGYTIAEGFWGLITAIQISELEGTPDLILPPDVTINEFTPYTAAVAATDSNFLLSPRAFVLVSGPPGLAVSPSGVINWTPDETQGPSTNLVTIGVTDGNPQAVNVPLLSATNTYTIIVNEVNSAPELTVPAMQIVCELATLTVTNIATDTDLPPNDLTFAMVAGPSGAVLDPSSGVLTWTPTQQYVSTTNIIIVRVTDNGVPSASDTKAFAVAVVFRPRLLNIFESPDGQFTLEWQVQSGRAYRLQFSDSLSDTNWTTLGADHTATGSSLATIDDAGTTRHAVYRLLDVTAP